MTPRFISRVAVPVFLAEAFFFGTYAQGYRVAHTSDGFESFTDAAINDSGRYTAILKGSLERESARR